MAPVEFREIVRETEFEIRAKNFISAVEIDVASNYPDLVVSAENKTIKDLDLLLPATEKRALSYGLLEEVKRIRIRMRTIEMESAYQNTVSIQMCGKELERIEQACVLVNYYAELIGGTEDVDEANVEELADDYPDLHTWLAQRNYIFQG